MMGAVHMTSRPVGDRTEFTMINVRDSMEAVHVFQGHDPTRAVFYPDDDRYLGDRKETVTHHDVYATA
jgi:hypothetical protein